MSTELALINEQISELHHMIVNDKSNRLNDSLFSKELSTHYMELAVKLSTSSIIPKHYQGKPQDLFICMAMGYQMGLPLEQAIQCIAVINGRPCVWGDEMLALCMVHKDFEDIIEEPMMDGNNVVGYKCTVKRRGMSSTPMIFTLDMAKRAGYLSKPGPWQTAQARMLQLRARSFALRDKFPDALKGIKSREEIEDYVDAEYSYVTNVPASRTEQLKQDWLSKTGKLEYVEEAKDTAIPVSNETAGEVAEESAVPQDVVKPGVSEISADDKTYFEKVKALIVEKGLSDTRLTKALKFYEISSIEDLSLESAEHFINQLEKL